MINCYFCKTKFEEMSSSNHYQPCPVCPTKWDVSSVYTIHDNDELMFASIYIDKSQMITIPATRVPFGYGYTMRVGINYQIRYSFKENNTTISSIENSTYETLMVLPGAPITPENARTKLKLYLLLL